MLLMGGFTVTTEYGNLLDNSFKEINAEMEKKTSIQL